MSFKVLVIPEDFRTDNYMLQPIIEAMFKSIGKPKAKIIVCADPNFKGDGQALKTQRIKEVCDQYKGMINLFILCVDRDGKASRRAKLDAIEAAIKQDNDISEDFIAENAWQEIEAWILVGLDKPPEGWNVKEIREADHPKEDIFEPLATERGLTASLGGGRKAFADEAAKNYKKLRSRCKEDIQNLEKRIKAIVNQTK